MKISNIISFAIIIFVLNLSNKVNSKEEFYNDKNGISISCKDIPYSFNSYDEAYSLIFNAKYKFVDHVNTSRSSWIRSADYLSCDKETGFFIISTDSRTYIHQDMPIDLWYAFKSSDSFGSFYSYYIKNGYRLRVN